MEHPFFDELKMIISLSFYPRTSFFLQILFLGQPVDQLPVSPRVRRARRSQVVDGLKEISLSLGVLALDEDDARGEVQLQADIVSEIGEGKVLKIHFVLHLEGD